MSENDDELTQAERIRRLMHRCDMKAEHVAELKDQLRANGRQCRAQHREIEDLRDQTATLRAERDEARRFFNQLRELFEDVREERDELRVEVCRLFVDGGFSIHENVTVEQVAHERGWDCFKEDTK